MTETENRINTLREFTNIFTPIWFWKFDTQFNVIQSDCPDADLFRSFFLKDGRREAIEAHMATSDKPVCFTVSSLLSWIMAFGLEQSRISSVYIMGPFFVGENDPDAYSDYLVSLKLPPRETELLRDKLQAIPVLSSSAVAQNAVILHYCVQNEKLPIGEVTYYESKPKHQKHHRKVETDQFEKSSGGWAMEQELLNRIRKGDLTALEVLSSAEQKHTIHAFGSIRNLHAAKLNIHQLLTLISRASVDGGLPQKTAFSLCSEYRDKLEKSLSLAELEIISNEMIRDYASRVHNMKRFVKCSPQIRLCCEYIDTHPEDKLTLEDLAKKAGYSPSHLSRKFHEEMKCSIIQYIQHSKLDRAKYLLSHTECSVDAISAELGYNTRAYFTTVFKYLTGKTPTEYRRENLYV